MMDFTGGTDDGGGSDNWSYKMCKAPVKSSSPTNHHIAFYTSDALPVAQPTVSKHWREMTFYTLLTSVFSQLQPCCEVMFQTRNELQCWWCVYPGCVDHAPRTHQSKAVLVTVWQTGLVSCPHRFTSVNLHNTKSTTSQNNTTTRFLTITSVDQFQNSFTVGLSSDCIMHWSLKSPSHLKHVAPHFDQLLAKLWARVVCPVFWGLLCHWYNKLWQCLCEC